MRIYERRQKMPISLDMENYVKAARDAMRFQLRKGEVPIRMAITATDGQDSDWEIGILQDAPSYSAIRSGLFEFRHRGGPKTEQFNVAFIVPTGIGAKVGGHAGDATPVIRAMSHLCNHVITHPNVVNASDINEMTENTLYVEGSVLDRFLMGMVGLRKIRTNRILVVLDAHEDELFVNCAINAVSAARATLGADCRIARLNVPLQMVARYSDSGRAAGTVENLEVLCRILDQAHGDFDAVAIASIIDVPAEYHQQYFDSEGDMVNPWGGVEAILTHTISTLYGVPAAHAPMLENREIAATDVGVVEPRLAAESVSMAFLHCVLKGLHKSPSIVLDEQEMRTPSVLSAEDVSCVVIPANCLGLPTIAALEQGISVIEVKENKNLMRNDLSRLPWRKGQYFQAANYWEAIGILSAMKAGVEANTLRRPIGDTEIADYANEALCRYGPKVNLG